LCLLIGPVREEAEHTAADTKFHDGAVGACEYWRIVSPIAVAERARFRVY
jgi:hypothetical protein